MTREDLRKKVLAAYTAEMANPRPKTAAFPLDGGGAVNGSSELPQDANQDNSGAGGSKRNIPKDHPYDPKSLKPMAKTLWATSVSLGHALTAYRHMSRLKSATISPDGMLGGRGYVMNVSEMRKRLYEACESLSAITDTLHDEINAPHWKPRLAELDENEADDVERFIEESQNILDNPEEDSEAEAKELEEENDDIGKDDAEGDVEENQFEEGEDTEDGLEEGALDEEADPAAVPEEGAEGEPEFEEDTDTEESLDEDETTDPLAEGEAEEPEDAEEEEASEKGKFYFGDPAEVDEALAQESGESEETPSEDGSEDAEVDSEVNPEEDNTEVDPNLEEKPGDKFEEDESEPEDQFAEEHPGLDEDDDPADGSVDPTKKKPLPDTEDSAPLEEDNGQPEKSPSDEGEESDSEDEDKAEPASQLPNTLPFKKKKKVKVKQASAFDTYDYSAPSGGPRVEERALQETYDINPSEAYPDDAWGTPSERGYDYNSPWENNLHEAQAMVPDSSSDATPTDGWDFGLGYGAKGDGAGGHENPSGEGDGTKGVWGPQSGIPGSPSSSSGDTSDSLDHINERLAQGKLPNDDEDPVARSDYYRGDKGNMVNAQADLPGEPTVPGYASPGALNTDYVYEDVETPYVRYDYTTHTYRDDPLHDWVDNK